MSAALRVSTYRNASGEIEFYVVAHDVGSLRGVLRDDDARNLVRDLEYAMREKAAVIDEHTLPEAKEPQE